MTSRSAIERELSREEIVIVRRWALDLGLPANAWHRLPGLVHVVESVSIERRAARARRVHEDLSERASIELAAARVGVRPKSHMRRLQRWIKTGWRQFVPDASIDSGVSGKVQEELPDDG